MSTPRSVLLVGLMVACSRGSARPQPSEASTEVQADAGTRIADATVDGAASSTADAGLRLCAGLRDPFFEVNPEYLAGVRMEALRPVDREVFSPDQRKAKRAWQFEAPARIALEDAQPDRPPFVVMGDAELIACERLAPGPSVAGPFSGVASSAAWTAREYSGIRRYLVLVADETGRVRGMRAFTVPSVGTGFSLARREIFSSGGSLFVESYVSADGDNISERGVYGFVDDTFVELFHASETFPVGALDVFTLESDAPSAAPTLTVRVKAHPAPNGDGKGTSRAVSSSRRVVWDPRAHTFH